MIREHVARPLTDLTEHPQDFLAELKQTREPILLTVDGREQVIVQDFNSYSKMLDAIERLETREAIREGLASIERGEGRPIDEFFEELIAELMVRGER